MALDEVQEIGDVSLSRRRQVEDKLRRAIVQGQFAPGEHLSDRTLCEKFKVSRTVVREAVRQLEAEGLVESFPNRGSFVRVITADEAEQIYDLRGLLEAWAIRKFVRAANGEQLAELTGKLEDMHAAMAENEDLVEKKQAFYDVLFGVYHNNHIRTTLNQILSWSGSGQLRATSMSVPDRLPHRLEELQRVIDAVRRRDEEGAWQATLDHVGNTASAALSVLSERKPRREVDRPVTMTKETEMKRDRYEAGLKVRREVLGREHVDRSIQSADDFNRPMQDLVTEYCWGEIWTREGLDRKTRSLLNLAMLTALNRPHEVELHVRGALNNGVSKSEMSEVFLQAAIYCGVPAAIDSFRIARKVFDEAK